MKPYPIPKIHQIIRQSFAFIMKGQPEQRRETRFHGILLNALRYDSTRLFRQIQCARVYVQQSADRPLSIPSRTILGGTRTLVSLRCGILPFWTDFTEKLFIVIIIVIIMLLFI